jgi:hypothetical protein
VWNLKNGSWWQWSFSTPSLSAACSYETSPWNTTNLVGDVNGNVYSVNYTATSDAGTAFAANWTSGVLQCRQLTGSIEDTGSLQDIRAFSPDVNAETPYSVTLGVLAGDGLDRFQATTFGTQLFDGVSNTGVYERPQTSENFQITLSYNNPAMAPRINALWVSVISEGPVRTNV